MLSTEAPRWEIVNGVPRLTQGPAELVGRPMEKFSKKRLLIRDPKTHRAIPESVGVNFSQDDRTALMDAAEDKGAILWKVEGEKWRAAIALKDGSNVFFVVTDYDPSLDAEISRLIQSHKQYQEAVLQARENQLPLEAMQYARGEQ